MVDGIISRARDRARKHIERLYESTCTVYEYTQAYDSIRHCNTSSKAIYAEGVPCHIAYNSKPAAAQSDTVANVSQGITLYLAPDIVINEGSVIVINTYDNVVWYKASGTPAIYHTHQEVSLIHTEKA